MVYKRTILTKLLSNGMRAEFAGVKTDDGRGFTKVRDGHRLSEDFSQTEAYSILFMELATNDNSATAFINGVIPQNMAEELAKASQA